MARQEQDREDLLKEATALVERVELAIDGMPEHVVVGFRADGCASFYFGPEPVWHFNTSQELRRAYVGGLLYKAEQGRLVSLQRNRTSGQVQLLRHELTVAQQQSFLEYAADELHRLKARLEAGQYRVVGQVPPEADIAGRALRWLLSLPMPIPVAASPNVR